MSLAVHQADAFINGLGISVFPRQPLDGETPSLDFPGFRFSQDPVIKRLELELKSLGDFFR